MEGKFRMSDIYKIAGIGVNSKQITDIIRTATGGSPLDGFFATRATAVNYENALAAPVPAKPVRDVVDHHVAAALAAGILGAYPAPASPREAVSVFVDVMHELERRGFTHAA